MIDNVLFVAALLPVFYCYVRRSMVAMPIDSAAWSLEGPPVVACRMVTQA